MFRRIAAEKKKQLLRTSTLMCTTKPSVQSPGDLHTVSSTYTLPDFQAIRRIPLSAVNLYDSVGKGVFGECYNASLVSHTSVCVKVFRQERKYSSVFPTEAILTSKLCHPNLPWLFGIVCSEESRKMLIISFHGVGGKSHSLHQVIHDANTSVELSQADWRKILLGLTSAVSYIHNDGILHNDIKCDNILLDGHPSNIRCVLIDFGKGCFVSQGKHYKLSKSSQEFYSKNHPQIAPDLRDGHCKQSYLSDIYSVGRVIKKVNEQFLNIPVLDSYVLLCTKYLCTDRPSTSDLYKFMANLL